MVHMVTSANQFSYCHYGAWGSVVVKALRY
jgi:hypothetical protein